MTNDVKKQSELPQTAPAAPSIPTIEIIDVLTFGKRPPNLIPEDRLIEFGFQDNKNNWVKKKYQLDQLLNEIEAFLKPRGGHLLTDFFEGTWTVVNPFKAAESGTFFQDPRKIMSAVQALFKTINAQDELDEVNEILGVKEKRRRA
jgi:hypothetical protein